MMTKLRPKDIFLYDPALHVSQLCTSGDLRMAKRQAVFGRWYKTPSLAAQLLEKGSLSFTFSHEGEEKELTLTLSQREDSHLVLQAAYGKAGTSLQDAGTLALTRYETAQNKHGRTYMGIIEVPEADLGLEEPELAKVQEAKHAIAQALGMYLLAMDDRSWAGTIPQQAPAAALSDQPDTANEVAPLTSAEKDELLQLRQEKKSWQSEHEELVRLRLEAKNRQNVMAELERLRQELSAERLAHENDRKDYEDRLEKQAQYIDRIKKAAATQTGEVLSLKKQLEQQAIAPDSQKKPAAKKKAVHDPGLTLPPFMTQRDYTQVLDLLLRGRQIALAGGEHSWQQRMQRRFPAIVIVSGRAGDDRLIKDSSLVVVNTIDGKTPLIRWALDEARDKGVPSLEIPRSFNLNHFAQVIVGYVSK